MDCHCPFLLGLPPDARIQERVLCKALLGGSLSKWGCIPVSTILCF
jgi:hypothetical protein